MLIGYAIQAVMTLVTHDLDSDRWTLFHACDGGRVQCPVGRTDQSQHCSGSPCMHAGFKGT